MTSISCSYLGDLREKSNQLRDELMAIMAEIKTTLLGNEFISHPKRNQIAALIELLSKPSHSPEDQNLISMYIKRIFSENEEIFQRYKRALDHFVCCQNEYRSLSKKVMQGG